MMNYIYGPIPSRRLGKSLGISPISKKTCNLSCVYCQLGLTDKMTNDFTDEFKLEDILLELKTVLDAGEDVDVVSIVGDGEPTLYQHLEELIEGIKMITDEPVAVITNGTRFNNDKVYKALLKADIVLPSIDAYDEESFVKINRPHKSLEYQKVVDGLIKFSHDYQGKLWLETMVVEGINDSLEAVEGFKKLLGLIKYDKYYLNSPVRPPALKSCKPTTHEQMEKMAKKLGGINIDHLADPKFFSFIKDDYEAILSIIKRHPMNQFELKAFLDSRKNPDNEYIFKRLKEDIRIECINYKKYDTYRFKVGEYK
jgi:wyosine [tRNA(Phe)-imidazoG37] synthetase (radical SAM superfamily)